MVGTGDFTHPIWAEELRTKLVPAEPGLFRLRDDLQREVLRMLPASVRTVPRFMLSTEISTIYKRDGHTRKVHHLLYAPDLDAVAAITATLARIGNLHSDGRPILGLDSRDLLEITLAAGDDCYLVPAHVWTPWFAVLGSRSGFDAVEDCYADLADHIFALETGLSADPPMFWRISGLDRYRLVGNSDAHSPPMLGRETTFFDTEVDYFAIRQALRTGEGFGGSAEFFPEEGKYHLDGHRGCGVRLTPEETGELGGDCPVCHRPVTVGVLNRVASLADRAPGYRPPTAGEVISLVSLPEIVGEILGVGPKSKAVATQVNELVARLGPELGILTAVPFDAIAAAGSSALVEAIGRLRRREVIREAGFDGEYGVIRMFDPKELAEPSATLFDLAPEPLAPEPQGGSSGSGPGPGRRRAPRGRAPWRSALADQMAATAPAAPVAATAATEPQRVDAGVVAAPSVLDGLDPDQRAAAAGVAGPLLIVAGPGTGKTRTLVHAVAHRVREAGVAPSECLAVTFTRRSRDEVADRLTGLVGARADQVTVATFHGLGLRIVRECHERLARGPEVAVAEDAQRADLLREAFAGGLDTPTALRRAVLGIGALKRARAQGSAPRGHDLAGPLARYDAALREHNLVDLDDLLALPVALLVGDTTLAERYRNRWRHVWVDEYQDVDEVQYHLLRLLVPPDGHLTAIGDPDQAIYGFRGAEVGFFLRFEADFPGARVAALTRNYRSTPTIVSAALQAVAPTTLVPGRVLVAAAPPGRPGPAPPAGRRVTVRTAATVEDEATAVADTVEELLGGTSFHSFDVAAGTGPRSVREDDGLSFADIAVLYRTDRQAGPVLEALARRGYPVQKRSHRRLADAPGVRRLAALLRREVEENGRSVLVAAALRRAAQGAIDGVGGLAGLGGPDTALAAVLGPGAAGDGRGTGPVRSEAVPEAVPEVDPEADPEAEGAGPGGRPVTIAEIRAAADLLAPLAAARGTDLVGFLTDLALDVEVDAYDPRADRISLLTLHAAKGLEFDVVIIVGCSEGLLPLRWATRPATPPTPGAAGSERAGPDGDARDGLAEERRLFFVGMTRARRHLVLTHAATRVGDRPVEESTFLAAIAPDLVERRSGATGPAAPRRPTSRQLRLV